MLDEGSAKERMGFLYNLWSYETVLLAYINSLDLSVFQGKSVVWGWGKMAAKTRSTLADHSCSLALPRCTYASTDRLLIGKEALQAAKSDLGSELSHLLDGCW